MCFLYSGKFFLNEKLHFKIDLTHKDRIDFFGIRRLQKFVSGIRKLMKVKM